MTLELKYLYFQHLFKAIASIDFKQQLKSHSPPRLKRQGLCFGGKGLLGFNHHYGHMLSV